MIIGVPKEIKPQEHRVALLPSAAYAEKRVALLIGNQSYESEIGRLANPHNDVALLEKSLKGLGFDVAVERDASRTRLHYCG